MVCDVLLWRKPATAILVLTAGTAAYFHCHVLNRSAVALAADSLLVLTCAGGILGFLSRHLNYRVPIDPLSFELSEESVFCTVSFFLNLVGAAEGVLRVAASGSDYRLFAKVVTFFYLISAVGRACSGTTAAYLGLWFMFIVPYACSKIYPEPSSTCASACRKRFFLKQKGRKGGSGSSLELSH